MSKPKSKSADSARSSFVPPTLPEGYVKRDDSLVGFWQPDVSPIHFIPQEAVVSDSKLEPQKQSAFVIGTLVDACSALQDKDGELVEGRPGDRVAVWAKPGMRELKQLAGVKVFMYSSGERDVGKQQPMQLFDVCSEREGDPLPVEDRRKLSAATQSWLVGPRT